MVASPPPTGLPVGGDASEDAVPGAALLLGSGPLLERLAEALGSRRWETTRAQDVAQAKESLSRAQPRAIILHPADLREAATFMASLAAVEAARGIPLLAVLEEAPQDPDDLPSGADAYLIDPSPEDLLEALGRHVVAPWSGSLGGQHALDVIESLDDGVFVIDRRRRIVYHNPTGLAFVQRTTRRSGPLLGETLARALPSLGDPRAQDALRNGLEHGVTSHVEVPVGEPPVWLSVGVFPNPDGATLVARDVTGRRRLEDALLETRMSLARSEKSASLGELVAGVAHEIRTPLVHLGNSLGLIRSEMARFTGAPSEESAARIHHRIEEAWGAFDRAVRKMKELQRLTRPSPGARARVDLSEAMQDAITLFAATDHSGSRVRVGLQPGLFVQADVERLQQVLLNLLRNAVEASSGSAGPVDVTTRLSPDGRAELVVADAGTGMGQEVVDRMFDPLFTTKKDGTGLGLGIVQRIVQEHGGRISCATAPGQGATFTVAFPLIKGDTT